MPTPKQGLDPEAITKIAEGNGWRLGPNITRRLLDELRRLRELADAAVELDAV